MNKTNVDELVASYAQKYGPLISAEQAAEIACVPLATIYDWSSQGHLDGFKSKCGRRVRFNRDAFVRHLTSG